MRTIPAMPVLLLLTLPASVLAAQAPSAVDSSSCAACAAWNAPQAPFQIYGNTYYVGTRGLSALLITSAEGHVLVDGGLPESGPLIVRHIRELGFRIEDVKLILNSHAHFDHAGGIALLQQLSGAPVMASSWSAEVLRRGSVGPDDPQYGAITGTPPVANLKLIGEGETLQVGPIAITPHFTPGHTPGGTSWSWESCGSLGCRRLVYGDSQSAVSAPDFKFTRSTSYPGVLADFARSFDLLERLPCEILLTPHPEASGLWERLARREAGTADALIDSTACRRYAETTRARLARRVAAERSAP